MNYVEICVAIQDQEIKELLMAQLVELGFESFEETEAGLMAFVPEAKYKMEETDRLCDEHEVPYSIKIIPSQNWNALWESNFEPIKVDDFAGIRAAFHEPLTGIEHEIIITPKMSFGTGHHATTFMMMQLMREIDFTGKTVFDYGTGTGILAILAEKLGAPDLLAVDYDDWCIENATENIERNNCKNIKLVKADTAETARQFDIVLANINKNIIMDNLSFLGMDVKKGSHILLSGLLEADGMDIVQATGKMGWVHKKTIKKDAWIAIHLTC